MMRRSAVTPTALAVLATLVLTSYAGAAVRRCGELTSSDVVQAADEQTGKMKALELWTAKALKLGPGFDSWRLAVDRALKCFPGKAGGYECMAVASPCIVMNNPNREPAGPSVAPDGKGQGL
jgi:hypothetical protein